ncbi:ATP-binding protein [Desulfobacterales bacterium HSG17]|nr:ATP-binding protein [Desulfobacterales bacterium HSG17]
MNRETVQIVCASFMLGCLYWFVDALYDYFQFEEKLRFLIFQSPQSFIDALILAITPHDLFMRTLFLILCIIAGSIMAFLFNKRIVAENELQKAHETLEKKVVERTAELKKANQQLSVEINLREETENELQALFSGMQDLVMMMDHKGTYLKIAPTFPDLFYRPGQEALGKTLHEVLPEDTADFGLKKIKECLERNKVVSYEYSLNINSKKKWFNSRIAPLQQNTVVVVATDITERKLYEDNILSSKQEAENANQVKNNFLANMSHEIRTPISGVFGMIKMALDLDPSPDIENILKKVEPSIQSLSRLIDDILDISKIEFGRFMLEKDPFNLYDAIDNTTALYSFIVQEKGLNFITHISPDVPKYIRGDSGRLGQVIRNLLSNAVKFTEKGSIDLSVKRLDHENDTDKLLFSIKDTGIGIPEEHTPKLFEKFVQLDGTYSKKYSGTGLGLAISKDIVSMMGGDIWVKSTENQGTTFYFTMVLDEIESPAEELFSDSDDRASAALKDSNIKVLLAEDERLNQMSMNFFLNKAGYQMVIASNGVETIECLRKEKFDIILMDIQMPEMDGIETARVIRESNYECNLHIPIIALTAYAMKDDREKFLNAGMDDYISKPVDFEQLFQKINRLVELKR